MMDELLEEETWLESEYNPEEFSEEDFKRAKLELIQDQENPKKSLIQKIKESFVSKILLPASLAISPTDVLLAGYAFLNDYFKDEVQFELRIEPECLSLIENQGFIKQPPTIIYFPESQEIIVIPGSEIPVMEETIITSHKSEPRLDYQNQHNMKKPHPKIKKPFAKPDKKYENKKYIPPQNSYRGRGRR